MPVKKNGVMPVMPEPVAQTTDKCCGEGMKKYCCQGFGKMMLMVLVGILLVYIIVWFGTLTRNNIKKYFYIGQADRTERTITVDGQGIVKVVPDVATTNIGFTNKAKTVEEAQAKNTEVMNSLIVELKKLNIESKDVETANYYIYPKYIPAEEGEPPVLDGYEVSQSVTVKIRDFNNTSKVLALAGQSGANQVSGLDFKVDDPEVYKDEARQEAIDKALVKANDLARRLGVRLVNVMAYSEWGNGAYPLYDYGVSKLGMGMTAESAPAPQVEAGSEDVTVSVSVTFEIR